MKLCGLGRIFWFLTHWKGKEREGRGKSKIKNQQGRQNLEGKDKEIRERTVVSGIRQVGVSPALRIIYVFRVFS